MLHGHFRWKPMLGLTLLFGVLAVGWFFLHRLQMRSIHGRFLEMSHRDEEAGQFVRAARFMRIYLLAKRDDVDALAKYGELAEKIAQHPAMRREALMTYEQVLEKDGSRHEIRLRAAKLGMGLGHLNEALAHLAILHGNAPTNHEYSLLLGDCMAAKRETDKAKRLAQWDAAETHYRNAIRHAPNKLEAYARLARLLRENLLRPADATQVLEDMVRANPRDFQAFLARAVFRQSGDERKSHPLTPYVALAGHLGAPLGDGALLAASAIVCPQIGKDMVGAGQDFASARSLAPREISVLLGSALHEMILAQSPAASDPKALFDRARGYLDRAAEIHGNDVRVMSQRAALELAAGQRKEAIAWLRAAQMKASGVERNRLLWDLASLLIDDDQDSEVDDVLGQLRKGGEPWYRINFLKGRMAFRKSRWSQAANLLEGARPSLENFPGMMLQCDLLLAQCYEHMGNLDLQLAMYLRAKTLDPFNAPVRVGLARTLSALGRVDEAIQESQIVLGGDLLHVRFLILRNLNAPPSENPDWTEVDEALKSAAKKGIFPAREVDSLRSEAAFAQCLFVEGQAKSKEAQGKTDEAKKLRAAAQAKFAEARSILEQVKTQFPEEIEPWIGIAMLVGRTGDEQSIADALEILETTRAKFGDRAEWRLAKLRYAPARKEDALVFLKPLAENVGKFDRPVRARLLGALADSFERAGDLAQAEKLMRDRGALEKHQLGVHLALFDFYLRHENLAGMESAIDAIKTIEGPEGSLGHFGKAQALMFQAGKRLKQASAPKENRTPADKHLLADARRHLNAARAKRPRWSRIHVALAGVAEMEGNTDLAITHLREAVNLGNRQMPVIRSLVIELMRRQQLAEADQVLRKIHEVDLSSDRILQMTAAEIARENQNLDRAFELTRSAIARDSQDYLEHLWQGRMLAALGKYDEAETSLRMAASLAKDNPLPWVNLVQLYSRGGDLKKARATMEEMKTRIPAADAALPLAQCYEILGEGDKVESAYQAALARHDLKIEARQAILQSLVTFHQNRANPKAMEPHLRQLLDAKLQSSDDLRTWARRTLAISLMFQDDAAKKAEALELIDQNLKANPGNANDQIAKGTLLAGSEDKKTCAEGVMLLEKAFKAQTPTPDQMLLLATAYKRNAEWRKASNYMIDLLGRHAKHEKYPRYLTVYVDWLSTEEPGEAPIWMSRLTEIWQGAQTNPQQLAMTTALLTDLLRRHPRLVQEVRLEANFLRAAAGKKEQLLVYAQFFGQIKQTDTALDLCEQALKETEPLQAIDVAVSVLGSNSADAKQFARVEAWLQGARQQNPKLIDWDVNLAILKERQASYAEAEALYRSVLKRDADHLVASNNLAFLVGLQDKGGEAIVLIEKLISKHGPLDELLDTRACILGSQGRLADAEADLRRALKNENSPYRRFHLAQVLLAMKKTPDAVREFQAAIQRGLNVDMLHPLERESFQRLKRLAYP